MSNKFGSVTFEGKEYTLTQMAYCDNYGTNGAVRYYASAVDGLGNTYKVAWETTTEWNEASAANLRDEATRAQVSMMEDESLACDWDRPINVWED